MSVEPTCDFCGIGDKLRCRKETEAVSCSYLKPAERAKLIAAAQGSAATAPIPPRQHFTEAPKAPALKTQIGGSHYKDMVIQPMTYSMVNGLDACQHTIIKYVSRFRQKGGIEDLEKAKHCIDLLIEFERERGAA